MRDAMPHPDELLAWTAGTTHPSGGVVVLTQKIDIIKLAPAANQHPSRGPVVLISGQPRLPARRPNV